MIYAQEYAYPFVLQIKKESRYKIQKITEKPQIIIITYINR